MTLLNPFSSIFRRLCPALLALACMMPLPALSVVAAPAVHLPVAVADGSFRFDVAVVPGETFYIDPYVAVGYTYAIGAGNPSFRSVLLPAGIGDGLYDLFGFDSAGALQLLAGNLAGGMAYDFGAAGVDRFQVTGIEVSAGLDPADPTAFVTGLGFTGAGRFSGTQTPVVVAVTEPAIGTLLLLGMGLLALSRRRMGTGARRNIAGAKLTKRFFRSRL